MNVLLCWRKLVCKYRLFDLVGMYFCVGGNCSVSTDYFVVQVYRSDEKTEEECRRGGVPADQQL